jgi:hypothetical protein
MNDHYLRMRSGIGQCTHPSSTIASVHGSRPYCRAMHHCYTMREPSFCFMRGLWGDSCSYCRQAMLTPGS